MPDENDEIPVDPRPSKATPLAAGEPEERPAVTGRPVDEAPANSTFADRAKDREASEKRIASAKNKAVQSDDDATTKAPRKRK